MGCYVNPREEAKETWLNRNGLRLTQVPESLRELPEDMLPVCLVDNGVFTAAGVAYSEGELQAFAAPGDLRPKQWYAVLVEDLKRVSPIESYLRGR